MIPGIPFFNDAVAASVVQIADAGTVMRGLHLLNTTGLTAYLQVFGKKASDVVLGTTPPLFSVRLAANATCEIETPVQIDGTGFSVAGTTTPAGAAGAAVSVLAFYGN